MALFGGLGLACLFVLQNRSTVHAMLDHGFLYVWSLDLNKERQKEDEQFKSLLSQMNEMRQTENEPATNEPATRVQVSRGLPGQGGAYIADIDIADHIKEKMAAQLASRGADADHLRVMAAGFFGVDAEAAGLTPETGEEIRQWRESHTSQSDTAHVPPGAYSERRVNMPSVKNPTRSYSTPASILQRSEKIAVTAPVRAAGIDHFRIIRPTAATQSPVPVVLLFHGAGRDAGSMLDIMSKAPSSRDFLLVAAQSSNEGWGGALNEQTITHMLDDLPKTINIDRRRVFAFGHSAGAHYVGLMAVTSDGALSAAAAHGGMLDLNKVNNLSAPNFPEPMRVYIGAQERVFPFAHAKPLTARFVERGHDIEMVVLNNHNHWFYDSGFLLCEDALRWFASLPPTT